MSNKQLPVKQSEFMSLAELSLWLGLPKSWLYGQATSGAIPFYKLGRYLRFRREEVEAWLARRYRCESPAPPAYVESKVGSSDE